MSAAAVHPGWLLAVSIAMALLPLVVTAASSYLKISIVLGMLRSGLGTPQVPGSLVITALSFALTLYVMGDVIERSVDCGAGAAGGAPLSSFNVEDLRRIGGAASGPWREFMAKHTGHRELEFVADPTMQGELREQANLNLAALSLAFMLTELKEAFAMAFALLLPFLVIDLIIANILTGMGMFMVSPVLISLPLKLLAFVYADGWLLLMRGLAASYEVQ